MRVLPVPQYSINVMLPLYTLPHGVGVVLLVLLHEDSVEKTLDAPLLPDDEEQLDNLVYRVEHGGECELHVVVLKVEELQGHLLLVVEVLIRPE